MPKQGSSEAKASLYLGCDTANINGLITDAHFAKEINLYDVKYSLYTSNSYFLWQQR